MTFDRGAIVLAADPFKSDDVSRPWLLIGTDETPFHGVQFIALTLSTKTWYDDRIPIDDADIVEGGLPKESSILPWAVASIESDRIDRELAALDEALVDDAVEQLGSYLSLEYPR